eukprot:g39726.t1
MVSRFADGQHGGSVVSTAASQRQGPRFDSTLRRLFVEFAHSPRVCLYGEFADHFRLSECKLAIIHCAGHSDTILVQTLWQEIIEKELADSRLMSCMDRMQTLSMKLVSLGKLYAGTPRYFPLEFLVQYLEQQSCVLSWDTGFVTFTMQEIGISLPRLLQVYNQLFKTR